MASAKHPSARPVLDTEPESEAEALIAGAIGRIGADPARLEELGLLCDLFSRIPVAAQRDLVVSVAAMVALGDGAVGAGRPAL